MCFRSVGSRFNLGKSSVFHCFVRVIKALNIIASQFIVWLVEFGGDVAVRIQQEFCSIAGLEGVVGAIDGTYIPVKAPEINPEAYINRKCFMV